MADRDPVQIEGLARLDEERTIIPAIAADGSLFPIGKLEAHRLGQKHLAVSVFVFAGEQLLIQRRADGKYHCGGQWANTCCTHPHWGESPADCARRRLMRRGGPRARPPGLRHRRLPRRGGQRADRGRARARLPRRRRLRPSTSTGFDRREVQELAWVEQAALRRARGGRPRSASRPGSASISTAGASCRFGLRRDRLRDRGQPSASEVCDKRRAAATARDLPPRGEMGGSPEGGAVERAPHKS